MRFYVTIFLTGWILSSSYYGRAEDWPHWRGMQGTGVVDEESGFNRGAWPPGKPAWKVRVGLSGSSPIVAQGRLFSLGWSDEQDTLFCLDAVTGQMLWKQSYPCPLYGRRSYGDKELYSGPSSCPTYDPLTGFVYTLSTDGDLHCWNAAQAGKRVWGFNLYDRFGVAQRPLVGSRQLRDYGYTSSPLVEGNSLIVEVGDDEGNLMAFSKHDGTHQWSSQSKQPAGHSGGMVRLQVDEIPCVAVLTIRNLLVARLDPGQEGKTLAEFPWITDFANNIATPVVQGNSLVITSAYNQYSICRVDVTRQGAKEIWRAPYAADVCSPVLHQERLYFIRQGMHCLDFATGQRIWSGGKFGLTASLLATADDRLIVWADRGQLVLLASVAESPDKYRELSSQKVPMESDVWPHLVLSHGRLYCKDWDGSLVCFEL